MQVSEALRQAMLARDARAHLKEESERVKPFNHLLKLIEGSGPGWASADLIRRGAFPSGIKARRIKPEP